MGIVSFDFDGTLCCVDQDGNSLLRANPRSLTLFKKHKNKQDKIGKYIDMELKKIRNKDAKALFDSFI
mgnify:CR=1 FL=1